jgi:hypothetical protein
VAWIAGGGVALSPLQPELFWRGDTATLPTDLERLASQSHG